VHVTTAQRALSNSTPKAAVTVYCDERSDEILAERYLVAHALPEAVVARLPSLAKAPLLLRPLLTWERLDWVVTVGDRICCTVEFSRHGYTGDNGFQRFARLFRSASLGIPTVYFTPFSRTRLNELDDGRESPRNVAPELFQTLKLMSEEFSVACLAIDWPTAPNGTPSPLNDPAVTPTLNDLCSLVADFARAPPGASEALVAARYPQLTAAMDTQAGIAFRGTDTRRVVRLPVDVCRPEWVRKWLPANYFGSGKADKVLALLALESCAKRPIVGSAKHYWTEAGEAWVLFLGYQWRPDPASGLIALAAARAKRLEIPLIVVWPRVFLSDGVARRGLLKALTDFRDGGSPTIAHELRRLGKTPEAIQAFRERLNVDAKQFGLYTPDSKPGRILAETAQTLVLGDAVVAIGS
jgi:hypothetical protein